MSPVGKIAFLCDAVPNVIDPNKSIDKDAFLFTSNDLVNGYNHAMYVRVTFYITIIRIFFLRSTNIVP